MIFRKPLLAFALFAISYPLFAQTDADALRYSSPTFTGTSRSAGVGGAMTGLGGDISSLGVNPAGIAQMGISEFSFTGGFSFTGSKTGFQGNTVNDEKAALVISHVGVVFVPKKNFRSLKNISIGATYNQLINFNDKLYGNGSNNSSSQTDAFAETLTFAGADSASAANNFPFDASLAFLGDLIFRFDDNTYASILELPVYQQMTLTRSGNMSDFNLGTGFAVNDYFSFGIGLGIPTINYEETYLFKETDRDNVTPDFNYWEKRDRLRTEGVGVNAKFGVLVQPAKYLRMGASFTTPTRFSMSDQYTTFFRSDFDQFTIDNFNNPTEGIFEYKLTTPWRLNLGASVLSGDLGLITVDYEVTNPSSAKFDFDDQNFNFQEFEEELNNVIQNKYAATHTVRVGVEGRIKDYFRARAGFQYRTSAFSDQEAQDDFARNNLWAFSGGGGYRGKNYYLDVTYMHMLTDQLLVPYNVSFAPSPTATTSFSRGQLMLTFGIKF